VLSNGDCLHRALYTTESSVCHFTERPRKTPGLAPKLLRRRHRQSAYTLSPMVLTYHLVAGAVEGCKRATVCVRIRLQQACLVGNLDEGAAKVLTLLVRIVEGEGRRGAVLPRLRAEVVIEARASRHRLGVEVRREGAILPGGRECRSARRDKPSPRRVIGPLHVPPLFTKHAQERDASTWEYEKSMEPNPGSSNRFACAATIDKAAARLLSAGHRSLSISRRSGTCWQQRTRAGTSRGHDLNSAKLQAIRFPAVHPDCGTAAHPPGRLLAPRPSPSKLPEAQRAPAAPSQFPVGTTEDIAKG